MIPSDSIALTAELSRIPGKSKGTSSRDGAKRAVGQRILNRARLSLSRPRHPFPIALEGALKLKEISYIHAEGYPAGEMKHGPNALIDETFPVVIIATQDKNDPGSVLRYEKTISNLKEVKARAGRVMAVVTEGDEDIRESADHVIFIPPATELLLPILEIVPLQLLAYHIAVRTVRRRSTAEPRQVSHSRVVPQRLQ